MCSLNDIFYGSYSATLKFSSLLYGVCASPVTEIRGGISFGDANERPAAFVNVSLNELKKASMCCASWLERLRCMEKRNLLTIENFLSAFAAYCEAAVRQTAAFMVLVLFSLNSITLFVTANFFSINSHVVHVFFLFLRSVHNSFASMSF